MISGARFCPDCRFESCPIRGTRETLSLLFRTDTDRILLGQERTHRFVAILMLIGGRVGGDPTGCPPVLESGNRQP
jgi:hypothetical protein